MKLLLDQNVSHNLVAKLRPHFPDTSHLRNLGMRQTTDEEVWQFARANGFALLTKDFDFYHRALTRGHPPKVIWLNIGNCNTSTILNVIERHLEDIHRFALDANTAILVLAHEPEAGRPPQHHDRTT